MEIGRSLAASIRNPENLPPFTLSAITAGPVESGAARSTASRGTRLRSASHEACVARWQTKIGRDDVVLVDRTGRGYGDDYSPWLLPDTAPVGELVRVRGGAVSDEGILAA